MQRRISCYSLRRSTRAKQMRFTDWYPFWTKKLSQTLILSRAKDLRRTSRERKSVTPSMHKETRFSSREERSCYPFLGPRGTYFSEDCTSLFRNMCAWDTTRRSEKRRPTSASCCC